jgi:DNA-binding transcriptional LysR family regulator
LTQLLRPLKREPNVVERVTSLEMMLTLVGAGYGVGFTTAPRIGLSRHPDVVMRPLAMDSAMLTTYLLRLDSDEPTAALERLIARLPVQLNY